MAEKRESLVMFGAYEGPGIVVKLEGPFVLRGGVTPTQNRAIVTASEFAKLGTGRDFKSLGSIMLYYSGGQTPDHVIQGVRIYDVEPLSSGRVLGEPTWRVDEVRIYLCDFRERFVPPRGGVLTQGKLNDAKLPTDSPDLKKNSQLVGTAMEALGIPADSLTAPPLLDRIGPPRDLDWNGTPAGPELVKLLQNANAVLCPQSDGSVIIDAAGTGAEPDFASMEELPALSLPGLGRRGKTIILTSAPYAVLDTVRVAEGEKTWEYVAQDFDQDNSEVGIVRWKKVWRKLDQITKYGGLSAQQAVKEDFRTSAFFRDSLREDTYRCIRVKVPLAKQGVGGVLRLAPDELGDWAAPEVMAKIAVQQESGFWINSPDFVRVPVTHVEIDPATQEYILRCRDLLGRAGTKDNDGYRSLRHHFTPLTADQIKVRFTREVIDKNGARESFTIGFRQTTQGVQKLTAEELKAAIASADAETVFAQAPELRLRRINGEDQNLDEVEERAESLATAYLDGSGQDYQIRTVKGFVAGELSGRVCEIAWDQESLTTTFKLNGWHYPLAASGDRQILKEFQEAFKKQNETASSRMESGGAGVPQPNVPVSPASRKTLDEEPVVLKITGEANTTSDDGGKYSAVLVGRNATTTTAGNLAMPEGMKEDAADATVIAINPEESGCNTHLLEVGSYVVGVFSGKPENGVPVYTIAGLKYKSSEVVSLLDTQGWTRLAKTSGDAPNQTVGDTAFSETYMIDAYWDEATGVLRKKTRTRTIDAGGRVVSVTPVTDSVIDTAEDCT